MTDACLQQSAATSVAAFMRQRLRRQTWQVVIRPLDEENHCMRLGEQESVPKREGKYRRL